MILIFEMCAFISEFRLSPKFLNDPIYLGIPIYFQIWFIMSKVWFILSLINFQACSFSSKCYIKKSDTSLINSYDCKSDLLFLKNRNQWFITSED